MKFPIPQDWDGVTWCRWSICWPDSELWRGFLRGLVTLPQRGWTWDERSGDLMAAIQTGKEITAQNLPLNGVLMACNDELLANAFNNIAVAIGNMGGTSSKGQCCGSVQNVINNSVQNFVPSVVDGSPVPVYGSVPALSLPSSGVPDGFETLEQYHVNKCQLAHQTVDGVAATLRGLGAITVFNIITLGGLVLASIASTIFFPPAAIPALLAAMLLLTGGLAVLVTMGDLIAEHRDELICVLYESDTVEDMIQGVEAVMVTLVALLPISGALALVVKAITMMFFNTDTLNGLMSNVAALGYPDAECNCGSWWSCAIGSIVASDANSITLESIDPGDFDQLTAVAYSDDDDLVSLQADITGWIAPSDHPEFAAAWDSHQDACGAGLGFGWENISADPEPGPVEARTMQHRGNVVFTVTYTRVVV